MLLRIAALLLIAVLPTPTFAKPNIILVMADDIGFECYGCYGSKQYKTPNIDRIAKLGMQFKHCYSQPLCTPSRVKIMTGISNVRNYSAFSVLNRDQKTFGHHLKKAGYKTFIGGKWQLLGAEHYPKQLRGKGSWPEATGFDQCCLWQVDKLGRRFWDPLLYFDGKNQQFAKDDYGPDIDFSDFVPTFQELAGAPVPGGLDGVSFAPQLRGDPGKPREWMYCYYNPRPEKTKPARFVRDQRWKLYGDGRFFDVANDPEEQSPLATDSEARNRLAKALASMPAEGESLLQFGK